MNVHFLHSLYCSFALSRSRILIRRNPLSSFISHYFQEQIEWAVDAGADFIIGETYGDHAEAMVALECIKTYGKGIYPYV